MSQPQTKGPQQDTFIIERVFNAPRDVVWKMWTDPALLSKWFGPKGATTEVLALDLRPGGIWHSRIEMPGAPPMWGKLVYQEIIPPSKLVWHHSFSDEKGNITRHPFSADWPLVLLTTVTFEEQNNQTKVKLTWTPVEANDIEQKAFADALPGMNQGWGGSFDQLEECLI